MVSFAARIPAIIIKTETRHPQNPSMFMSANFERRSFCFAERKNILSNGEKDEKIELYLYKTYKIKIFCARLLLFTQYMV